MMKKFYGIVILILFVQFSFAQKISNPQLIAPENEIENAMPDELLDWSAVTGVGEITYHLQLATDDAFSNLIIDEDGIEITSFQNNLLLFGQQYFWRVKAMDMDNESDWSATNSFTVFSKVVLDDPNGDDEVPLRPILSWDYDYDDVIISGVSHFRVELDTSMSFDSPMLISENAPAELDKKSYLFAPDYLNFGTVYYWRVKPANSNSEGEFDEVFDFETIVTVELDEPGNGDEDIEFDHVFEWQDLVENKKPNEYPYSVDLFEYTLELSLDEAFTNPVVYVMDSNSLSVDILKFNREYFWRVKASHVNDESVWSEVFNFNTVSTVELDSPENDEFLTDTRPVLEWKSLAKVDGYQIVTSKNADLSDPTYYIVNNGKTETYPLAEQESGYDYYWSVRAFNGADTSNWAETRSFYISGTGVNDLGIINNINLYPNPAKTYINVSFNVKQATELSWIITDVLGQNINEESFQIQTGLFSRDIDVADLNKGIYFLEITQGTDKKVMKFVVK